MSKGRYKVKSLMEVLTYYDIEVSCPIIIDDCITDYYVTTFGRVYRIINNKIRYLKPIEDDSHYLRVKMSFIDKNGKTNAVSIMLNRLVAYAFIPNPDPDILTEVNHINGKEKHNNHVWNLEWCTHSYNMKHAYDTNLRKKGEDNKLSIYSNNQIRDVCKLLVENEKTKTEISQITGVSVYTIENIIRHRKWTHISKEYDIDKYNVKAVNTGSIKKYTNEIIHNVCRLIEKGENTLAEISNITNVGFYTIANIKRHKTWKNISCNYDF